MLGFDTAANTQRDSTTSTKKGQLVGYVLTTKAYDPGREALMRLENKAFKAGYTYKTSEFDVGYTGNPYRVGLWRALRRMVCATCEPRRLPYSLVSFEDYISQALKPCMCGCGDGLDGIVVSKLDHITSDPYKGTLLVVELARMGKHVIADDGICLSCCHPSMQKILGRAD